MEDRTVLKRRRWADVVVIVAAVYLLLASIWSPLELLSGGGAEEVADTGFLIYAYAISGVLGLLALWIVGRAAMLGKILVALAGIVALAGFATMSRITTLGALSLGVPGVAMLIAAAFVGRMPTPEEEGKPRRALGE